MPKDASTNFAAAENKTEDLSVLLKIKLEWPGTTWFGSEDYGGVVDGRIIEFSGVSSTAKSNSIANVATVSFTLADPDGMIKARVEATQLENTVCKVYQYFMGEGGDEGLLIFNGKLTNPITWNEETRTVAFSAESIIEGEQVGFAMESGYFAQTNEHAAEEVWPIVFGECAHVPALLAQRQPRTQLLYKVGVLQAANPEELYELLNRNGLGGIYPDIRIKTQYAVESYTVNLEDTLLGYGFFGVEDGSSFSTGIIDVLIDNVVFRGEMRYDDTIDQWWFDVQEINVPKYTDIAVQQRDLTDRDYNNPLVFWIPDTNTPQLVDHYLYLYASGNPNMDIDANQPTLRRVVRQENNKIWIDRPFQTKTGSTISLTQLNTINQVRALPPAGTEKDLQELVDDIKRLLQIRGNRLGPGSPDPHGLLIKQLELIKGIKELFWNRPEGTLVREWGTSPDIYVAHATNINASYSSRDCIVYSVYGIRNINGKDRFVPVPKDYYTISSSVSGNLESVSTDDSHTTHACLIRFQNPLQTYKDQNWREDIYVTLQSDMVGDSTLIIKHILDEYTDLTTDNTTFNSVSSTLANFPARFTILNKWDALNLAQEIAWQSRCGLILDGSTIKIKYLASVPGSTELTFTDTDIEFKSIQESFTPRRNVITRLVGKWRSTYRPFLNSELENERDPEIVFENNIDLYGRIEEEYDIFIYDVAEMVQHTLDFWGYRYSNIWKVLTFKTFHKAAQLDVFDPVMLTLSYDYINNTSLMSVVDRYQNRIIDSEVILTLLLPVEAGSTNQSSNFWINDIVPVDTTPYAGWYEFDYDIQAKERTISLDEAIDRLATLREKLKRKGIVQSVPSDNNGLYYVRLFDNGFQNPYTSSQIQAYASDPYKDYQTGEVVTLSTDQYKTHYIESDSEVFTVIVTDITTYPDSGILGCQPYDIGSEVTLNTSKLWVAIPLTMQAPYYIANPIGLWTFTYGGDINTREAVCSDPNVDAQTQTILPAYEVGSILFVRRMAFGKVNYGGSQLTYVIDTNIDARAWAHVC